MSSLELIPIQNIPIITPHTDLALTIVQAMKQQGLAVQAGDIVLLAQKIVSKAEDCFVTLSAVTPSARAQDLAQVTGKDPREIEVILRDTKTVVRTRPGLLIVEHRLGFICANAGLDHSNVLPDNDDVVLSLPQDPDQSARQIRQRLAELTGQQLPVLIIDSHGRPWRIGVTGVVIGLAGLSPIQDLRGQPDLFGDLLKHTEVNLADQLAAAASLVMGQADEAQPVVIARGLAYEVDETAAASDILRAPEADLFR